MNNLKKRALIAAAAAAKLTAGSFQANAGIVYDNPEDVTVHQNIILINQIDVDIDGGGDDLFFSHSMTEYVNNPGLWLGVSSVFSADDVSFDFFNYGDVITDVNTNSQSLEFASANKVADQGAKIQDTDGPFESGGQGFLGFNLASGNNGWLSFTVADFDETDKSYSLTLHDWAYEDSGKSIKAGDVPEPATWALFALGAYYISRKRNKTV